MSAGHAMLAAALLRFFDPWTSIVQTDDATVAELWRRNENYWPVPMGLEDPLARKVQPRVVHALFQVHDAPPKLYDPDEPSPLFKVNQVGYLPWAPKYAYLGAWLGPVLGPWKSHAPMTGWQLVDAASGEVVKDSPEPPRLRVPDGTTPEGTPFTGEETHEMDFSDVTREGEYFLRVPGVGRSRTFKIAPGAAEEAFRVHMGGLYQKRCGIAKEEPWTHWTAGSCHEEVVRGTFPPGEGTFDQKADWFEIIRDNTDWEHGERLCLKGGWHDAADYDRRPQHLRIVNDLCAVYLMKPGNFPDGQLAIPESSNGIPDILDEAEWGLRHLLAGQCEDGGVGTWVESTGHPGPGNVAARDPMRYALSRPTRGSSLSFAALASLLARCHPLFREKYLDAAIRAWNFAMETKPRKAYFRVNRKTWRFFETTEMVQWTEPAELPPLMLVKAALNLHALTGAPRFLEALEDGKERLLREVRRNANGWSPLVFSGELALGTSPATEAFFDAWKKAVMAEAEQIRRQLETSYAYRIPWWAPRNRWTHAMSWGNSHPLRRAQWFVAAHGITGDPAWLEAASLANDFHNGCNPRGMVLTSGLGEVYPVAFLDLPSYVDGIAEFVPGITPFRWTYGMPARAVERVFGGDAERASKWPVWRRWGNLECLTVAASEFTVWETIAPAASVTGYLLDPSGLPPPPRPLPAKSLRDLEGYWAIP